MDLEPCGELFFFGHASPRHERQCHYHDAARAGEVTPGPTLPLAAAGRRSAVHPPTICTMEER